MLKEKILIELVAVIGILRLYSWSQIRYLCSPEYRYDLEAKKSKNAKDHKHRKTDGELKNA